MTDIRSNDILVACSVGDLSWLKKGLANGSDPCSTDGEGLNGLHLASKNGKLDCLKHLLNNRVVNINAVAEQNRITPLHCSVLLRNDSRNHQCMKLLLDRGADHSIKDDQGQSVLHYVAKNGYIKCLRLLLQYGVNIHEEDSNGNTAYKVACLNNQHECARLLRALHWAHRKDSTQNEKMQEEQVQQRREEEQKALQNRLKAEKADIAYSDWLEKKEFGSARTVPQECEIRKRVRTTPSTKSSSCTTCTPSSKHQSAHHGQKTIVPTKVSLHQEERNLKSVGKPDKMHPYTNHPLKPKKKVQRTRKNNRKCKSAASLSESRSGHNFKAANQSSVSMPSEITLYNTNEERELTGAHGHKEGNRATVENKMTVHLNSSNPKEAFEPSLDNSTEVSSEDSGSESEESGSDNQFNNMNFVKMIQNDTNEDDDDDYLPFPQFGFDMEDDISESLFHDVGESNDLNSLSLPPILTKGRTPAEVLQLLRHLGNPENSKRRYRRSNSISYSSRVYSGHYKRRLSLGSIPEGKIVTDYTEQEDDDNLDSQILKNLANAIDCISGTEKGDEENDPHIQWHDEDESGEQNSAAAEELVVNEEENEPSEKLESSSSSFLKVNDTQSSNCDLPQNNKATPPPQTLKVINFFWDPASNSVQTHIAATPLISPRKVSHRSPSPTSPSPLSLNVTSPSGLPPMVNTPSRKVTPPTSVDTPLSYTATPPPRKVTPPSHKVAPPSYMQTPPSSSPSPHKITPPPHKVVPPSYMQTPPSSSIVTPSPRKVTPPPSYVETPSTSTPSPSYADTASFSSAMINSLLRKITPPSRKNTPPSRKNTPPSRKNTPPSCRSTPPSHGVLFPLTESIQSTHDEVTASYHPSSSSPIHQSNSDPCFYPRDTLASQNPLQSSSSSPNSLISNHETKIFFIGDAEETVEPELEVTKQSLESARMMPPHSLFSSRMSPLASKSMVLSSDIPPTNSAETAQPQPTNKTKTRSVSVPDMFMPNPLELINLDETLQS